MLCYIVMTFLTYRKCLIDLEVVAALLWTESPGRIARADGYKSALGSYNNVIALHLA